MLMMDAQDGLQKGKMSARFSSDVDIHSSQLTWRILQNLPDARPEVVAVVVRSYSLVPGYVW
jgi:hypothetical protein